MAIEKPERDRKRLTVERDARFDADLELANEHFHCVSEGETIRACVAMAANSERDRRAARVSPKERR